MNCNKIAKLLLSFCLGKYRDKTIATVLRFNSNSIIFYVIFDCMRRDGVLARFRVDKRFISRVVLGKSKPVIRNNINNDVCAMLCGCNFDSEFVKSSKHV